MPPFSLSTSNVPVPPRSVPSCSAVLHVEPVPLRLVLSGKFYRASPSAPLLDVGFPSSPPPSGAVPLSCAAVPYPCHAPLSHPLASPPLFSRPLLSHPPFSCSRPHTLTSPPARPGGKRGQAGATHGKSMISEGRHFRHGMLLSSHRNSLFHKYNGGGGFRPAPPVLDNRKTS